MDETEGDGIGTNTERTPLLGKGFGKTDNCRLGGGVVGLPNVSVKTRGRGNVDDGTVLSVTLIQYERHSGCMGVGGTYLDTHVGCSGADESEWSADVNLLDDVPSVIRESVKHLVVCEASCKRPSTSADREPTLEG